MTEALPPQRVLSVGQCNPDHAMIHAMLTDHFDVTVDRVMFIDEALDSLDHNTYALVLVNRLIFDDGSPGLPLVETLRANPKWAATPVMMVSNFPEAQAQAIAAGAVPGFGKAAIGSPSTLALLGGHLRRKRP